MSRSDPSVKLFLRVKLTQGWRYLPAVLEYVHGSWQAKLNHAVLNGAETHFPQGTYYIRSYAQGRKVYELVRASHPMMIGFAVQKARTAAKRASTAIEGYEPTRPAKSPTAPPEKAFHGYIRNLEHQHHHEAAGKAKVVAREFLPLCNAQMVKLINSSHVLAYHQHLRSSKKSPRTIADKHVRLKAFLRWTGTPVAFMPKAPKYENKEPEIYNPDQLTAIRRAAADDAYLTMLVEMALMLGLRMQELKYACWDDLDVHHGVFTVRGKPDLRFVVKDNEQREIPVPNGLLARLQEFHEQRPDTRLILGTAADKPNSHLLRALKRLAVRAGLNAKEFTLHQFRRTFMTLSLRGDFDPVTVKKMAGHSELTTTLRYLKPMAAKETRDKASAIWD